MKSVVHQSGNGSSAKSSAGMTFGKSWMSRQMNKTKHRPQVAKSGESSPGDLLLLFQVALQCQILKGFTIYYHYYECMEYIFTNVCSI